MIPSPLINRMELSKLTEREEEILAFLLERKEESRYGVSKELDIPYSTSHKVFEGLTEGGLIEEVRKEKSDRNVSKTIYELTPAGLLLAVSTKLDSFVEPDTSIERDIITSRLLKRAEEEKAPGQSRKEFLKDRLPEGFYDALPPETLSHPKASNLLKMDADKARQEGAERFLKEEMSELAEKHGDKLPLILGKWDKFVDRGIEKRIALYLRAFTSPPYWKWIKASQILEEEGPIDWPSGIVSNLFYGEIISDLFRKGKKVLPASFATDVGPGDVLKKLSDDKDLGPILLGHLVFLKNLLREKEKKIEKYQTEIRKSGVEPEEPHFPTDRLLEVEITEKETL